MAAQSKFRIFFLLLVVLGVVLLYVNIELLSFFTPKYFTKANIFLKTRSQNESGTKPNAGLNQHIWYLKATSIDFLCNIPVFPKAPDQRLLIKGLNFSFKKEVQYAERMFGFLLPSQSGRYKFSISSADSSELWLSSDSKMGNAKLIAYAGEKMDSRKANQNLGSISEGIELCSGRKYFIEALHIGQSKGGFISVQWKQPGATTFISIGEELLFPFFHNDFNFKNTFYDFEIPNSASCANSTKQNPFLLEKHTPHSSQDIFAKVLPNCNLPNLREIRKLERKEIKLKRHYSIHRKYYNSIFVYPYELVNMVGSNSDYKTRPHPAWNHNNMLSKERTLDIVKMLLNRTRERLGTYLNLKSIINIEKSDYLNGSRFLVEIDLSTPSNDIIHVSEYIYYDNDTLCLLTPWRRNVTVTFVVTAKNQGKWIHIFLENMASMIKRTQDQNIKAIIFDYESKDIDLPGAIAWRGLEDKVKIFGKEGRYSRRESFNLAVRQVSDPRSIIFLTDLHLTIGDGLVDSIRKHTIEGEFIYTPAIIRQWKDTTAHNPRPNNEYGYYDFYGYGLMGIYKSDWDRVGGFPESYKYGWGGEDYDLMDRVFKQGLEYIRIKCPYVYHYNHDRKKMWTR